MPHPPPCKQYWKRAEGKQHDTLKPLAWCVKDACIAQERAMGWVLPGGCATCSLGLCATVEPASLAPNPPHPAYNFEHTCQRFCWTSVCGGPGAPPVAPYYVIPLHTSAATVLGAQHAPCPLHPPTRGRLTHLHCWSALKCPGPRTPLGIWTGAPIAHTRCTAPHCTFHLNSSTIYTTIYTSYQLNIRHGLLARLPHSNGLLLERTLLVASDATRCLPGERANCVVLPPWEAAPGAWVEATRGGVGRGGPEASGGVELERGHRHRCRWLGRRKVWVWGRQDGCRRLEGCAAGCRPQAWAEAGGGVGSGRRNCVVLPP